MNCHEHHRRLDELLEGAAGADVRRDAEAHRSTCASCSELWSLATHEPAACEADSSDGLADRILRETSGSACERAGGLLAGFVDDELPELDRELFATHIAHCASCEALTRACRRLTTDLQTMARIAPDSRFARDVLAATVAASSRWTRRWQRFAASWATTLQRPRLAWEAGYVGAVAVWLFLGGGGIASVSRTAIAAFEDHALRPLVQTSQGLPAREHVQATVARTLEAGEETGADLWRSVRGEVSSRLSGTDEAVANWTQRVGRAGEAAASDLGRRGAEDLRTLGRTFRQLVSNEAEPAREPTKTSDPALPRPEPSAPTNHESQREE